jgi:hypothetical protein
MPVHLSRRASRALTSALAGSALTLALAAPGHARPAVDPGVYSSQPAQHGSLAGAPDARANAQTGSLAGTTSRSPFVNAPGTDVAAPDQQNPVPAPERPGVHTPVLEPTRVVSIDRGATTLALIAIAAAALLAGAGAGFAGGRRTAMRTG